MLTGDKFETAENIAYSCRLFNNDMDIVKCQTAADARAEFNELKAKDNEEKMKALRQRGALVAADALKGILEDPQIKLWFLKIAKTCEAVVCCRVSPS